MSDVLICGECGQLKPRQRVTCPKHDFTHDPDKHCDHCENEVLAQFEREEQERTAKALANADATAKADAEYMAKLDADAKDANSGT